jgi:hypothetical protein
MFACTCVCVAHVQDSKQAVISVPPYCFRYIETWDLVQCNVQNKCEVVTNCIQMLLVKKQTRNIGCVSYHMWKILEVWYKCSEALQFRLQLIQMLDNLGQNMKNVKFCSQLSTCTHGI